MPEEQRKPDDTQLQPARPPIPKLEEMEPAKSIVKPDSGIGLTEGMDRIQAAATGKPFEKKQGLSMRTRMAFEKMAPYWNRVAWWIMLAIAIIVVSLDLNARFGGFIGRSIEWVRTNIMSAYPSVAFVAGMVACYYLVLKTKQDE